MRKLTAKERAIVAVEVEKVVAKWGEGMTPAELIATLKYWTSRLENEQARREPRHNVTAHKR